MRVPYMEVTIYDDVAGKPYIEIETTEYTDEGMVIGPMKMLVYADRMKVSDLRRDKRDGVWD